MNAKSKSTNAYEPKEKKSVVYPSAYGSHVSMLVEHLSKDLPKEFVASFRHEAVIEPCVLKDDLGFYVTERRQLGNGMADGFRFAQLEFREKLIKEMGINVNKPEAVANTATETTTTDVKPGVANESK